MQSLKEQIAYIEGLCSGLKINNKSSEGIVLNEIVSLLSNMATEVTYLEDELSDLEEDFYDDFYDDEDEYDYEDEYDDGDDNYLKMTCPACGAEVNISEEELADETLDIHCPKCDEILVDSVTEED